MAIKNWLLQTILNLLNLDPSSEGGEKALEELSKNKAK